MQGLMSQYPLTLTHIFNRAERLFAGKGVATVQGGGIERITYGEWAQRTRKLATVLDEPRDLGRTAAWRPSPGTPRRHLEALLRRAVQRARCSTR